MSRMIAIVGRPNVGKSTLFNKLVGQRKSIVEDMPGVTRDRLYGRMVFEGREFDVVDTGGFDPSPTDPLIATMKEQVQLAVAEADAVFFVMDALQGVTPMDEEIVRMLRRHKKPVFYLVNKCDGYNKEVAASEFYSLGVEPIHFISSAHGRNIPELMDEVVVALPEGGKEPPEIAGIPHVAVVGRPNVGKSTLINRMLGQQRLLTSDMPGTTRDSVDTIWEGPDGKRMLLVDTAGMRRKKQIHDSVEYYSVIRAVRAMERAHVAILVVDATEGLADQDIRIANLIADRGRAMILVYNKWDAVEKDDKTADKLLKNLKSRHPFLSHIPVLFMSGLVGKNVHKLMPVIETVKEQWEKRISTGELNRFVRELVMKNPPPVEQHRPAKFYFATQVSSAPPTIVFSVNNPDWLPLTYRRYLLNKFRDEYDFAGSPIRMLFRARKSRGEGSRAAPPKELPAMNEAEIEAMAAAGGPLVDFEAPAEPEVSAEEAWMGDEE